MPKNERQKRVAGCSAPFAEVVATWPCKRLWERTAIECVSDGSERIHTEVFRTASLVSVREKCERFFALMPKVAEQVGCTEPGGSVLSGFRTSLAPGR